MKVIAKEWFYEETTKANYEKDKILALKVAELGLDPKLVNSNKLLDALYGTQEDSAEASETKVETLETENKSSELEVEASESRFFRLTSVDNYYKKQSVKWIKNNPDKYVLQIPKKIFYLFSTETYSGSSFYNNKVSTGGIDYIKSIYAKIMNKTDEPLLVADFLVLFNQIWYMFIFVLFLIGFYFSIKYNVWRSLIPYMLSLFVGTGITLIVVGGARYHFPYIPVFLMYASFFLGTINKTKEKGYEVSKINENKTLC